MYLRLSAGSLLVVESSYSSLEFQTVIVYAIVNSLLLMRSTPQATLTAINCRRQTKVNLRLPEGVATHPRLFCKNVQNVPRIAPVPVCKWASVLNRDSWIPVYARLMP
jgi:hypothetical protein